MARRAGRFLPLVGWLFLAGGAGRGRWGGGGMAREGGGGLLLFCSSPRGGLRLGGGGAGAARLC